MIGRPAVLAAVLLSISSFAFADVTGTWNGTLSGPLGCPSGSATQTFTAELDLLQSGNFINGALAGTGPNDACQAGSPTITVVTPLAATISGSTFSGTYTGSGGGTHGFTATVNGSSMNLSLDTGDGSTLTGTLSQTSTQPPASGLTGTYDGTYTTTMVPCGKLAPITFSGTLTLAIIQAGSTVSGSATSTGEKHDHEDASGNCTVVDASGPETNPISGTVNGNSIAFTVVQSNGKPNVGTATVSGNTMTATFPGENPGETFTFTVTRAASGIPAPSIASFTANPSSIAAGDSTTLSWSTINAASVSIDNAIGAQAASGSVSVSPKQTTTYTLTATGIGGSSNAATTVTVTSGQPRIVAGQLPSGMIEIPGTSGATDSFTVSNVGSAAGTVTLTQSGNFFTVSPASFTLDPGASAIVTITANAQPAGTFDGTVSLSNGPTIPVHLLVAAPPTAAVNPQTANPRSDVSAPAGQNPAGSISITNNGPGGVTGIAVADVPWIIPQNGAINIAPGQTVSIAFNIDRSKRPDSASPAGGLAGKISLVYLLPVASKTVVPLGNPPTGTVSVTIVDVVKPNVAPGTPPPLQTGQLALFIDGLRTANRFNGDLAISTRPSVTSISDLQIFLSAGGNAQVSALPAFASSPGLAFPAINKNVFGVVGTLGGTLQVRSSQTPNIALSGVVSLNSGSPSIASATALPVLRSDRSIGAGEKLVFSGAQDSATGVWLQEVSGNAGHVSIAYLDANGATVGADSSSVPGFAALVSAAPDGTRAVVVTNDSTTGGRFDGYAAINDPTTMDGWILTDPLHHWGAAAGPLIVPLVQAAPNDIYVTNASNASATVTIETDSAIRHRAVRPASAATAQTMTVAAMSTARATVAPMNGFVRITSASALSAAGRVTMSASGATFGSSLPAVPVSAALPAGQGKRFAGVDDASAKTAAAHAPGTYQSALMLVEAAGQSATVHVTLTYTFVAGSTVSSVGVSSRDFSVGPNQMVAVANLARSVIGAQRDAFGDLRNMQVDVDVIGGSGKIIPFVESIDNASGDIMVRAD